MNERPMPSDPTPSDPVIDELLGAFALDALDVDERERVASYVANHERARREVDDLRETAAMLALAPIDHEPAPLDLWDRIAGSIEVTPMIGGAAPSERLDEPVDLAARRSSRRGRTFAALGAVAAAMALVVGLAALNQNDDGPGRAFDALAESGTTLELAGSSSARVALADGRGMFDVADLPELEPGTVYQAWAVYPDRPAPISIGVFDDTSRYPEFRYAEGLRAIAITVEDGGGVVQSTNDPIVAGAVS
jgi:anti-sigma-K factor RskA